MILKKTFAGAMVLVGLVMGLMFVAPYAEPIPKAQTPTDPAATLFESTCSTCHTTDRAKQYKGPKKWPEIIKLMRSFGALMDDNQAKQIEDYLQKTYPIS